MTLIWRVLPVLFLANTFFLSKLIMMFWHIHIALRMDFPLSSGE